MGHSPDHDVVRPSRELILAQCQEVFPEWRGLSIEDFAFADPKGFSSFTMGIRALGERDPSAVLYRGLEDKENAILDFEREKEVFLLLGEHKIATHCYAYHRGYRLEQFYEGRTLRREELFEPDVLRKIANELHRFHRLKPAHLPEAPFFELLHEKWGILARDVLEHQTHRFPAHERHLCAELERMVSDETLQKVRRCLPEGPLSFCHNDTYHGNVMKLSNGDIKLLDFEFSCLNHHVYDFSNLFAETVMRHNIAEEPHFLIAEPDFTDVELGMLINFYLDNQTFESQAARDRVFTKTLSDTRNAIMLSDYMYAMAALPLSVEPIQKIRFLPYAHQRFHRFLRAYEDRFGATA